MSVATPGARHLPSAERIPKVLLDAPNWVCWDPSKAPRCARGGAASSTDSNTWADFSTALAAANTDTHLAGVGYVFTARTRIIGVDLDDVRDPVTQGLLPWAHELVKTLDTYTERSPSGNGLHMFVCGELPANWRKQHAVKDGGKIECYTQGRYFTVTGDALTACDTVNELSAHGMQLLGSYLQRAAPPATTPAPARQQSLVPSGPADTAYGMAALVAECAEVRQATEGSRNNQLNEAACKMGGLVAGMKLHESTALAALRDAAAACGLDAREVEGTLASGFTAGLRTPRTPPAPQHTAPAKVVRQVVDAAAECAAQPERMDAAWTALQFTQGHRYAGIGIPAYPMLSDALFGLRGFTLLTGPTQAGKTTMTLSMALSVADGADIHCETCEPVPETERAQVVYVPAERGPVSLMHGMLCLLTGLDMRTLYTALHTLTDEQRARVDSARQKLGQLLGSTLHVVDPSRVDMGWSEFDDRDTGNWHPLCGLQRHVDAVTRGARCLVIVDTLAHLELQPAGNTGMPYRSDLDRDTDLTRGLKTWRAHLDRSHSAILGVHEESKERTGSGDTHAGRGSSKFAYVGDALLALMYADREGEGTRAMGIRSDDTDLASVTEVDLLVNKARDGGRSNTTVALKHHYRRGRVEEVQSWSVKQRRDAERSQDAKNARKEDKAAKADK